MSLLKSPVVLWILSSSAFSPPHDCLSPSLPFLLLGSLLASSHQYAQRLGMCPLHLLFLFLLPFYFFLFCSPHVTCNLVGVPIVTPTILVMVTNGHFSTTVIPFNTFHSYLIELFDLISVSYHLFSLVDIFYLFVFLLCIFVGVSLVYIYG